MNPSLLRSYHHSQSLRCFFFWKYNCFINFFVVFYFNVIKIATLNILYLTWNKINISVLNNININLIFLKRQIFEKLNLNWLGGINTFLQNLQTTIFKIWSFYYFAITFSFFLLQYWLRMEMLETTLFLHQVSFTFIYTG